MVGRCINVIACLIVILALCQAWIRVYFLLRDFIVVLWKTSSIVENQFSRYGIPGAWWDSTLSSLVVHPSIILWQQESCGVCVGSIFSPIEYIKVETLSHHIQWTVFFNFTCIFKLCYISGCEGDRLTCFLINTIRLLRENSSVLCSRVLSYKLFMTKVLCARERKAEVFQMMSINIKTKNFKLARLKLDTLIPKQQFKIAQVMQVLQGSPDTHQANGCDD